MKVIVREFGNEKIEQVFQLDDSCDVVIEIGIQALTKRFWITQPANTSLLRITVNGRVIIQPETANAICLTEAR